MRESSARGDTPNPSRIRPGRHPASARNRGRGDPARVLALGDRDGARHVRAHERCFGLDDDHGVGRVPPVAPVGDVGGDDGRHDAADRRADPAALRPNRSPPPVCAQSGQVHLRDGAGIRGGVGGLQRGSDHPAARAGATAVANANDGAGHAGGRRGAAVARWRVSADAAQGRVPERLPLADHVAQREVA